MTTPVTFAYSAPTFVTDIMQGAASMVAHEAARVRAVTAANRQSRDLVAAELDSVARMIQVAAERVRFIRRQVHT